MSIYGDCSAFSYACSLLHVEFVVACGDLDDAVHALCAAGVDGGTRAMDGLSFFYEGVFRRTQHHHHHQQPAAAVHVTRLYSKLQAASVCSHGRG